jgi:hypothetical protein
MTRRRAAVRALCFLPFVSSFFCMQANSQTSLNNPRMAKVDPRFTKSGRDADAIALLRKSLAAMGGAGAWETINSARLQGTIGPQTGTQAATPILYEYDWTNLQLKTRKETIFAGKKYVRLSTATDGVHSQNSESGFVSDFSSNVSVPFLPAELPAVAFLIALGDAILVNHFVA